MSKLHRRTYLRGLAASGVAATGFTASASARSATSTTDEQKANEDLLKGRALLWNRDQNPGYNAEMHLAENPEGMHCTAADETAEDESSDRSGVVHVTSNGKKTSDYAHGMVNLQDRLSSPLTVKDSSVSFDYYEGPQNARAAPDEVYVVIDATKTEKDTADADTTRQRFLTYTTINDGVDPDPKSVSCSEDNKRFRTVDVSDAMSSGDYEWTETPLLKTDFVTSEAIENTAIDLLDDQATFSNFSKQYSEDARLVGVGFGHGFTTEQTTLDIYYDDLTIKYNDGGTETEQFDFPAAVPTDVEAPNRLNTRRGGSFTVTVELQQDEEGIALDDVIKKSVRLTPDKPVAPPADKGVLARQVKTNKEGLTAQFPAPEVADLLREGETQYIVAGELDVKSGSSFFGVNTVNVFSPGNSSNSQSREATDTESPTSQNHIEWAQQLVGDLISN